LNTSLSEVLVRRIKSIGEESHKGKGVSIVDSSSCLQCGNKVLTSGGSFLSVGFSDLPLRFKVLFFQVTLGITADLEYCPKCGYLSLKFS